MAGPQLIPAPPRARPFGTADSGLARRHARNRVMTVLLGVIMAATLTVLAWVLVYVAG